MSNNIKTETTAYSIILTPAEGFKLRKNGDNTKSFERIDIPLRYASEAENYIAVSVDEADETAAEPIKRRKR